MSVLPHVSGKPSDQAIKLEMIEGNIALATFDQPNSRANTLNQSVLGELEKLAANLAAKREVRGLIFRSGKPGMYIAGADLRELGSRPDATLAKAIRSDERRVGH